MFENLRSKGNSWWRSLMPTLLHKYVCG